MIEMLALIFFEVRERRHGRGGRGGEVGIFPFREKASTWEMVLFFFGPLFATRAMGSVVSRARGF